VPTNIVEGHASVSKKEFLNFLNIANRSLVEVEYLMETACELKYMDRKKYQEFEDLRREVGLILSSFTRSLRRK
jgi:four helix bundle protein